MPAPRPLTIDELLTHADWVARLASRLAGPEQADDVVQDTWVAARLHPPDRERPPRPWLAEVVRNVVRARWQSSLRRRRREARVAEEQDASVAAVDALYERVELQRVLAARVMALDEPLRAVVLLRYFEGRESPEIGASLGIPAGTVRWRLTKALARLRADLDARYGGQRPAWALLVGVARPRRGGLVKASALVASALITAAAIVAGPRLETTATRTRQARAPSIGRAPTKDLAAPPSFSPVSSPPSVVAAAPASEQSQVVVETESALPFSPAAAGLVGQILDVGEGPVAWARIRATPVGDASGRAIYETSSACLGRYRLELPPGPYAVEITADGYAPVRFVSTLAGPLARDFRLDPGAQVTGRVRAADGRPVLPTAVGLTAVNLDDGGEAISTTADRDGRFAFAWLAPGRYRIEARAPGLIGRTPAVTVEIADRIAVDVSLSQAP